MENGGVITDLDTTVPDPVSQDVVIGEEDELDTMAMLRDHEALLRRIDTVLAKTTTEEGMLNDEAPGAEYLQFNVQTQQINGVSWGPSIKNVRKS